MTPAQREARRRRMLAAAFQDGWNDGAGDPPLTERQRERLAFLIAPVVAAPNRDPATLPQAA